MNFLSLQNNFIKSHNNNNNPLLSETHLKTTFIDNSVKQIIENNNQISPNGKEKTLQEVWSKDRFNVNKITTDSILNFNNMKMSWAEKNSPNLVEIDNTVSDVIETRKEETEEADQSVNKEESPSHHARRPPNAFLIFCKKHRPIVREKFPNLENRGVTKILGEWWALLMSGEKQPYNDLAKEYKDAFLSANPNFRWYKLPAPPLRTLSTRPVTVTKATSPLSSPSAPPSEFTPGKLADESQLGGLTSLMNNNYASIPKNDCCENKTDLMHTSPVSNIQVNTPPKPIKKRFSELYLDNKECARNLEMQDEKKQGENVKQTDENLTKQEIVNKVVDGIFTRYPGDSSDTNGLKEVRKSERMCKGKRYEMFMVEGKLLGNRREPKLLHKQSRLELDLNMFNNNKPETPKLDLENTIKRLAERTNVRLDFENETVVEIPDTNQTNRVRSISETSEGGKSSPPNFNLDLRISNLPCLSYDEFLHRKRESKKRKIRTKTDSDMKAKIQKVDKAETQLVGSKKRKNKQSITHIDKKDDSSLSSDLLGLATLAEVAANTEKINEKISE